jgi:hypothetical protein
MRSILLLIVISMMVPMVSSAQTTWERPFVNPIEYPQEYLRAVDRGTRTMEGVPGERYWQQRADYSIKATLHPNRNMVTGLVSITYYNHSPDSLRLLHLDLDLNTHKEGALRNETAEVTNAVVINGVTANGQSLAAGGRSGFRYMITGTRMVLVLPESVAPGASVALTVDWSLDIPQAGAGGRMGYDSGNLYFLAYWYPRMTVYDDLIGWHPDPFLSRAEFYHGFGNYEIEISAPANWVVMSTGKFLNPEEVLAPDVLARYQQAATSDDIIRVVDAEHFGERATTGGVSDTLTWKFYAKDVRDVAFSATRESFWDSGRTSVGDKDGDGAEDFIQVHSFWRESAPLWEKSAEYQQHAINFLSRYTGFSYPWPHMTAVEAGNIIGGGMEFPMMTIIGDYNRAGANALYGVTLHELAHMWIPLIVSSDERRYSWFDEGYTVFQTDSGKLEYIPGVDHREQTRNGYLGFARTGQEGEMMRWSDYQYTPAAFGVASYPKPATILTALKGVLGDEKFMEVHRALFQNWSFKLISPYDWFSFVESVSGENLYWFWRSWYFETWTMDHEVLRVEQDRNGSVITIRDNGHAVMPVDLTLTLRNGEVHKLRHGVQNWLVGQREAQVRVPFRNVVSVEIDADRNYPDTDRSNNVWKR